MKFWQKIYFTTLIIFLVFLNIGFYFIFNITYDKNIETEQKRAEGEFYILINAFGDDLYALQNRGVLNNKITDSVFKNYETHYEQSNISFELYKDGECICSNTPDYDGTREELKINGQDEQMVVRTINDEKYIYLAGKLPGMTNYTFVYARELVELSEIWDELNKIFVWLSIIISICLAIVLFWSLRHMTKPVKSLSLAVKKVAGGDYKEDVIVKGNDEIAELAVNFNIMAKVIEQKIEEVTSEAENKQIFIDNLAHEMRTPLTSIYGYAEYMQKANLTEDDRIESLDFIIQESSRLQNMMNQLLNLAMLRNEEIEFEYVSVSSMVESVKKVLKSKISKKNITFTVDVEENIEVYGNKVLLESLLINLTENAIRATNSNGNIRLTAFQNGDIFIIKVVDDGIGMKKDEINKIMEPFYRVDKARSRQNGGAGLGLALCKKIIEVHSAEIKYESEYGDGTTVTVRIRRPSKK